MNSWIFSPNELARLRREASTNAKSPLTAEEEVTLVHYFSRKIYERLPRFPGKVIPAAVLYLQRFYIHVSPATVSPRDLLLPVIFLSDKLNNNHNIHIDFDKIIKAWGITDPPSVLYDHENTILDTLRFNLDVITPHEKFVALVQDKFPEFTDALKETTNVRYTNRLLDTATTTDAVLMFTPGEIAIAVLELSLENMKPMIAERGITKAGSASATEPDEGGKEDPKSIHPSEDIVEQFHRLLPIRIKKFSSENRENINRIKVMILEGLNEIPRPRAGEIEFKLKCFKDGVPYPPPHGYHHHRQPFPPSQHPPSSSPPPPSFLSQEQKEELLRSTSLRSISLSTSPAPFVPSRTQSTVSFNTDSGKSSASPTQSLSPEPSANKNNPTSNNDSNIQTPSASIAINKDKVNEDGKDKGAEIDDQKKRGCDNMEEGEVEDEGCDEIPTKKFKPEN